MEHKPIIPASASSRAFRQTDGLSPLERFLSANRYVLGMALLIAVVIPEQFHDLVASQIPWFARIAPGIEPTVVASALALTAVHASFSRLGTLPLVSARSVILPTFLAAYGVTALAFLILRIPLGRYHLLSSFALGIGWYYLVSVLRVRYLRPKIGMIGLPDGFSDRLPANVDWKMLTEPRLPGRLSAVVVDPHASLSLEWSQFITRLVLNGIPVYHRSQLEEGLTGRVRFNHHADNDFGSLLPSLAYLKTKRLMDLVGCVILLPVFVPVIAIVSLLIRLGSPGPAIFSQVRMGHRGQPFVCYKLRTMRENIEGPSFTLEDDPRVTRIGRTLRKWRIDEFPQIFNVLKGEMSWIGPRPEAIGLARHYSAHVPFYDYRHAVRPGISGWAAVHQGNVAEVDTATEKLEYDFFYIRNFSPSLDFLIFLKTLQTIWSGAGAR